MISPHPDVQNWKIYEVILVNLRILFKGLNALDTLYNRLPLIKQYIAVSLETITIKKIKYLGINLTSNVENLTFFIILLKDIKVDMNKLKNNTLFLTKTTRH